MARDRFDPLPQAACFFACSQMSFRSERQGVPKFPKATGVSTPGIQRSMAGLQAQATFQVGGHPDWMALTERFSLGHEFEYHENASYAWMLSPIKSATFVTIPKPCSGLAIGFWSLLGTELR